MNGAICFERPASALAIVESVKHNDICSHDAGQLCALPRHRDKCYPDDQEWHRDPKSACISHSFQIQDCQHCGRDDKQDSYQSESFS
jgi:hypothetical protein